MESKKIQREKAINYSLRIFISVFLLLASYYALQFIIIKGSLFSLEPVLMGLFYLNCFVIGIKVFKT
jgi:hypothetical protein